MHRPVRAQPTVALGSLAFVQSLLIAGSLAAQPSPPALAWDARYDGAGAAGSIDRIQAIAADATGSVFVTGESNGPSGRVGIVTIKYSPGGQLLWLDRFEGPTPGGPDAGKLLAVSGDGGLWMAGNQGAEGPSFPGPDLLLVRYDAAGNRLWSETYDGPAADNDHAVALAVDNGGQAWLLGRSEAILSRADFVLRKHAADGTPLWTLRWDGPLSGNDEPAALRLDGAGNAYVLGTTPSNAVETLHDTVLQKVDPDGNEVWTRIYPGDGVDFNTARELEIDAAGDLYLSGTGRSPTLSDSDAYVLKVSGTTGDPLWQWLEDGSEVQEDYGLVLSPNGKVVFASYYNLLGTGFGLQVREVDAATGLSSWVERLAAAEVAALGRERLAVDSSGNLILLASEGVPDRGQDLRLISLTAGGQTRFDLSYGEEGNADDYAVALALDPRGAALVAGLVHHPGTQFAWDYATLKLETPLFADGFESGTLDAWSVVVGSVTPP